MEPTKICLCCVCFHCPHPCSIFWSLFFSLALSSIARGMRVILHDSPTVLTREAHALCGPGVSQPQYMATSAKEMSRIIQPYDAVTHTWITFFFFSQQLYKQRFFVQNLPHFLSLFESSSPQSSMRYVILLALANMMKNVPENVVIASLPTVRN